MTYTYITDAQFTEMVAEEIKKMVERGLTDEEILHEAADFMEGLVAQGYRIAKG